MSTGILSDNIYVDPFQEVVSFEEIFDITDSIGYGIEETSHVIDDVYKKFNTLEEAFTGLKKLNNISDMYSKEDMDSDAITLCGISLSNVLQELGDDTEVEYTKESIGTKIKDAIATVWSYIQAFFKGMGEAIAKIYRKIKDFFTNVDKSLKKLRTNLDHAIKNNYVADDGDITISKHLTIVKTILSLYINLDNNNKVIGDQFLDAFGDPSKVNHGFNLIEYFYQQNENYLKLSNVEEHVKRLDRIDMIDPNAELSNVTKDTNTAIKAMMYISQKATNDIDGSNPNLAGMRGSLKSPDYILTGVSGKKLIFGNVESSDITTKHDNMSINSLKLKKSTYTTTNEVSEIKVSRLSLNDLDSDLKTLEDKYKELSSRKTKVAKTDDLFSTITKVSISGLFSENATKRSELIAYINSIKTSLEIAGGFVSTLPVVTTGVLVDNINLISAQLKDYKPRK